MQLYNEGLERLLRQKLGDKLELRPGGDMVAAGCGRDDLLETCATLRDDPDLAFAQLSDLCGVDYSEWGKSDWQTASATSTGFSRSVSDQSQYQSDAPPPVASRFAVVYHLLSLRHNWRLRLHCCPGGEPPSMPSVTSIWASANWYEREAFDLLGIMFEGHEDLRRILTDYGFTGHPLRKDFPLIGEVEVRYDPEEGRVINQPVTIEDRTLVPRVIRHDNRYLAGDDGEDKPA